MMQSVILRPGPLVEKALFLCIERSRSSISSRNLLFILKYFCIVASGLALCYFDFSGGLFSLIDDMLTMEIGSRSFCISRY